MRISDWSSDVCSSDLPARRRAPRTRWRTPMTTIDDPPPATGSTEARTESAVALAGRIVHEVERAVIGKRDVVDLVLASVLAGGHVLLEDVPGVAKTLLARSMATACVLGFSRIQFTPDVLPSDIPGSPVLALHTRAPTFPPGPLFPAVPPPHP